MATNITSPKTAAVIGGGPAGLIAAEVLARAGLAVTIYDGMPSLGRKFLLRSAGLGFGGLAAGVGLGGLGEAAAAGTPTAAQEVAVNRALLAEGRSFDGAHQAGIIDPPAEQATFAALDAITADRAELIGALRQLSARARELSIGGSYPLRDIDEPPADSGTLGPDIAPDALTVTIGFGASLFDRRFGLAARRPRALTPMEPNSEPILTMTPRRRHNSG